MHQTIRRSRLALGGLALAGALLLGGAPTTPPPADAAPAANPPIQGITVRPVQPTPIPRGPYTAIGAGNPAVAYGFTLAARESDTRLVGDGFQWAEFEVDWGDAEPSHGSYN